MAKQKRKKGRSDAKNASKRTPRETGETSSADALTVIWTVSITTVLLCDLAAALGYGVVSWQPNQRRLFTLAEFLVFSGAVVGLLVLVLTPIVHRVRRTPPPPGLTVFAICAATAPLLAILARLAR